jgi:UDP-N-acetylglucosamine 1-carboxyvinyltransferase
MAAATLASGVTTITNAALEPEVVDLANFLNELGARITGHGTPVVRVEGVPALQGGEYSVIPDRIEVATLMTAAIATRGEVSVSHVHPAHLEAVVALFRKAGAEIEIADDDRDATLVAACRGSLEPVQVVATPYPGIPTDVQAQLTALLTSAAGVSIVADSVFSSRFMHVSELCRMGARIEHRSDTAIIQGGRRLTGASVMASDLRASAALVIAALTADGESTIRRVYHLDRGYERLDLKLRSLGGQVERVEDVTDAIDKTAPSVRSRAA